MEENLCAKHVNQMAFPQRTWQLTCVKDAEREATLSSQIKHLEMPKELAEAAYFFAKIVFPERKALKS